MKSYRVFTVALLASFVLVANGSESRAAIAGDDFDGGANNGGLTPTSLITFEGDPNNGVAGNSLGVHYDDHINTFNGLFDFGTGSRFDRFGYVSPLVEDGASFVGSEEEMASDYLDQTTPGVADPNRPFLPYDPLDKLGIQPLGSSDVGFALADTCNGSNINGDCAPTSSAAPGQIKGSVSAYWTFDISSGSSDMQLSIDFAAIGEFDNGILVLDPNGDPDTALSETADFLTFTYSIDGGPFLPAFDIRPQADPNGNDTEEFYTVTMDSDPNGGPGTTYDRYPSPFFDQDTWVLLHNSGPLFGIDYHADDLTDSNPSNSYLDDLEGALGVLPPGGAFDPNCGEPGCEFDPNGTRAYHLGLFDNTEYEIYKNPMYVNDDPNNPGTQLGNDLQTVTVPLVGSGSTLVLKLLGVADGSLEFTLFDNILIEDVAAANADFDGSGIVDGLDFLQWQRGDTPEGGSQAELALWEAQYGGPPPLAAGVSAVPEPASVLLLGIGLALIPSTLRRRIALR